MNQIVHYGHEQYTALWLESACCGWTGKQLQMNRMGMPQEEEGGGAETRVNVLSELPLLEARLDALSLRVTDAEQPQVGSSVTFHTMAQIHLFNPVASLLQHSLII